MKRMIVEDNPSTGIKTELIDERHLEHFNKGSLQGIVKSVKQDVRPILKHVEKIRDQTPSKEFRHCASVPYYIYNEWLIKMRREGYNNIPKSWIKEWCNDPDNAAFRTWPGRL